MNLLPTGFDVLESFVATWAVEGAQARDDLRTYQSAEARLAFHSAAVPLLTEALNHLDATPLAEHDAGQKRLMLMMLSLAHVSLAVDIQGPDETKHAINRKKLRITRAPADFA